jgi:hypothetical protein
MLKREHRLFECSFISEGRRVSAPEFRFRPFRHTAFNYGRISLNKQKWSQTARPSGLMVKAPDFGLNISGDWEFESSLGRISPM